MRELVQIIGFITIMIGFFVFLLGAAVADLAWLIAVGMGLVILGGLLSLFSVDPPSWKH